MVATINKKNLRDDEEYITLFGVMTCDDKEITIKDKYDKSRYKWDSEKEKTVYTPIGEEEDKDDKDNEKTDEKEDKKKAKQQKRIIKVETFINANNVKTTLSKDKNNNYYCESNYIEPINNQNQYISSYNPNGSKILDTLLCEEKGKRNKIDINKLKNFLSEYKTYGKGFASSNETYKIVNGERHYLIDDIVEMNGYNKPAKIVKDKDFLNKIKEDTFYCVRTINTKKGEDRIVELIKSTMIDKPSLACKKGGARYGRGIYSAYYKKRKVNSNEDVNKIQENFKDYTVKNSLNYGFKFTYKKDAKIVGLSQILAEWKRRVPDRFNLDNNDTIKIDNGVKAAILGYDGFYTDTDKVNYMITLNRSKIIFSDKIKNMNI